MEVMALALLWGFAEATLFFIVPEVLISIVAVRSGFRAAVKLALAAGVGARLGGAIMFLWSQSDPQAVRAVLALIPAISDPMVAETGQDFGAEGWPAMFIGAFTGVPYKIYAVEAGAQGVSLTSFLALTLPARLPRFLLTAAIAAFAGGWLKKVLSQRSALTILDAFWVLFSAFCFASH